MSGGEPRPSGPGRSDEASLESAAILFRRTSAREALADGARLIADVAAAEVSAVFVLRGTDIVERAWHERAPGLRERFEAAFVRVASERLPQPVADGSAAVERSGAAPRSPATEILASDLAESCGAPCRFFVVPAEGDHALVAAVAWPDGVRGSLPGAMTSARALVDLLAARWALDVSGARFDAQRTRYERWFRTLDQQLRLLDRERQKFSAVVHQSDVHVFVADPARVIRWTNKTMSHFEGDSGSVDWRGRHCHELCGALRGAAAGPCAQCPVGAAFDSNEPAHQELHATRHGVTRTLYLTALPIRGPDGRPQESMVMLQDVTDLSIVRRSEARYRSLFERSANAIVMVEPHRRTVVLANAMTARMLGCAPHELPGRRLTEIIAESDWPRIETLCSSVATAGSLEGFEFRIRTQSGEERTAVVIPSRFDLDGEEVLLLEFLDVTERKRAEQALGERDQQLRQSQKMEAVGRLAGGIAHGFNNLLAVIMGRIGLIRDRLPIDHPARRDADQIHNACVQGSWLTRHLLSFSRREMDTPRVIDLRAVVLEIDGMLRCVLGESIELVTEAGAEPVPVLIDPAQIEQVLLNLVINARDAMPEGGLICVDLRPIAWDAATARARGVSEAGGYFELRVRDDGVGMDEETRVRLFEPFFTTKERGKGSGLGMSIVYGTVTRAGGHIEVASELGMGTTVSIVLPRARQALALEGDETLEAPSAANGETVLVVDDDDQVRAVTCETLEMEGYSVLSACGGQEALEIIESHPEPIALMVTDVVMPGMGGGELAQRLAALRPDTRVIFVSGYVDDVLVRDGVNAAGAPFLQKPYPLEMLAAKAREVLDGVWPAPARARQT